MELLKQCARCRRRKPLAAFSRNVTSSDGLNASCRSCLSVYQRGRRANFGRQVKVIPAQRRCYTCQEIKPASEFGRDRGRPDGLNACCKRCRASRDARRATRPAVIRRKIEGLLEQLAAVEAGKPAKALNLTVQADLAPKAAFLAPRPPRHVRAAWGGPAAAAEKLATIEGPPTKKLAARRRETRPGHRRER
jgi:hypothetical protein